MIVIKNFAVVVIYFIKFQVIISNFGKSVTISQDSMNFKKSKHLLKYIL